MSNESTDDRRERLRAAAERKRKRNDAQQWDPDPGESIEGEFLGQRVLDNHYGRTPLYFVESFEGDVYSVIGRTALEVEMDRERPGPGDLVSITYEGRKPSEKYDTDFYSYTVVVAEE